LKKGLEVYKKETITMAAAKEKREENDKLESQKTPEEIRKEKLAASRQLYKIVDGNPVKVEMPEAKKLLGIKDAPVKAPVKELSMPDMNYQEDYTNHLSILKSENPFATPHNLNSPQPLLSPHTELNNNGKGDTE